jgi:hypothetical protein
MHNLFDDNPEAKLIENARLDVVQVEKGLSPDDSSGLLVTNPQDKFATTLICDGNAITEQPGQVELVFRLLKLKSLMLARERHQAPKFFERDGHVPPLGSQLLRVLHSSVPSEEEKDGV